MNIRPGTKIVAQYTSSGSSIGPPLKLTSTYTPILPVTTGLVMNLDAATLSSNPTTSTWYDSVSNLPFTLYSSPTYSSNNGGYLTFVSSSGQYAQSTNQSFGSLSTWTVEAWHYYDATLTGGDPCIVTEVYPGVTNKINFSLGTDTAGILQNGFFDGGWRTTSVGTLTSGNWYQLVGTYDGSTINLYINNSLSQSTSYTGTPTSSQGGIRLMRRWDLADYWGGRLGIVRIYNTALTPTQIQQNYNANKSRFGLT